jgi:hypothetical protein
MTEVESKNTTEDHRKDFMKIVQQNLLSKRNARLLDPIACPFDVNGYLRQFHQGDRYLCPCSTKKMCPEFPANGDPLPANGLVYVTSTAPFGKPLLVKFSEFLKDKKYQEILILPESMPTKQVREDLLRMSIDRNIHIDILEQYIIRIDRTLHVAVPCYKLRTKKQALELLVSKNEEDLLKLPSIFRSGDLVIRVLFRVGDIVLAEDASGVQLKRIIDTPSEFN